MTFLIIFVFFLAWACALAAVDNSKALVRRTPPRISAANTRPYGNIQEPSPEVSKDYGLLDIVLVASVDGKFHALNRTSGHTLWSMSSFATTTSVSAPLSLAPLVRTSHPHVDSVDELDDDAEQQETYIIEPQSGAIYVLQNPSSPLQRFPLSMSELVDLSPFTSNQDETTVFVGRKETSLLLIELETGKIKATLNSECPPIMNWDKEEESSEIDLDDLEDNSKPPISAPTEVYIGRTDYHISIYKKPLLFPIQNLSFSSYGPNNKDNHLQASYRRTNDDSYIQSLPNGEVISFLTKTATSESGRNSDTKADSSRGQPLWGQKFGSPIVAIFDVLQPHDPPLHQSSNPHAFVLLQPRPRLQDLFPNLPTSSKDGIDPNPGSAYVGLVEETGSLFAMSPDRYPLVTFGVSERDRLDPPRPKGKHRVYRPDGDSDDPPAGKPPAEDIDADEDTQTLLDKCLRNPYDHRCLVGVRPLDRDSGQEGRMKRLIDGPKTLTPGGQQPMSSDEPNQHAPVVIEVGRHRDRDDNASDTPVLPPHERLGLPAPTNASMSSWLGLGLPGSGEAVLVSLLFGLVSVWFVWKRVKGKVEQRVKEVVEREEMSGVAKAVSEMSGEGGKVEHDMEGPNHLSNGNVSVSVLPNGGIKKDIPPPLSLPPNTPIAETPGLDTPTAVPDAPNTSSLDDGDESEGEGEGGPATPGRRKVRRGKRGKKKKPGVVASSNSGGPEEEKEGEKEEEKKPSSLILTTSSPKPPVVQQPSLIVSDTILGFGSHGTVVFQGSLQGRAVAVKRLLQDFVTLAAREVSILQESDDHPNVIRYYYQEAHANFLYIALELCPASLADIIEAPDREQWRDIAINFDPKKALRQIASGLRHLHALKLVHRDIKPQNILVSSAKAGAANANTFGAKNGRGGAYRMLISDFGLCKKLDTDQTSFLPTAHGALAAGTVGWRAPEILRGEVKLDEFSGDDAGSLSSRGSVATVHASSSSSGSAGAVGGSRPQTRLTKSVDIFALGCLFYYTLTNGGHPYGDRFEREVNIMKDSKDLGGLERFGEEGTEAKDLITAMLHPEARMRPDTTTILLHPFFWDPGRRLNFLQDASDRFEIMCRDPKDAHLLTLERGAVTVVTSDWHARLDKIFIENLGKYRKYDGKSVQDLLRALRNKKHHYQDLPDNVKRHLGPMPEGFLAYFTRRYPQLFLHVHGVIKDTGLHTESMFRSYFDLPDS